MKWENLPEDFQWDRKLAYFLNPGNQEEISKEDLQDALAILAARYCDEFNSLRFLECFVEEELGPDRLDEAIIANVESDSVTDRTEVVMEKRSVEERLAEAYKFVNQITEEYGDLSDEDF